jgi:hypothetical protein
MHYRIIGFDEVLGTLTVEVEGFQNLVLELPLLADNKVYEGLELSSYIEAFLPTHIVERREKLALGIGNIQALKDLVSTDDSLALNPIVYIPEPVEMADPTIYGVDSLPIDGVDSLPPQGA